MKQLVIRKKDNSAARYAVIPLREYRRLKRIERETADSGAGLIPQEVIDLMVERQFSPIKAWRIYRKLSQSNMAQALGVTQSAFSQIERSQKCQRETLVKVAAVLGIRVQALDLLPG